MSIEEQLRQELTEQAEHLTVPGSIDERVRNTYRSYLKQKGSRMTMARKIGYATVASIVLFGGIISTGFVSPAMASVLKNVPFVGSVFEKSESTDEGLLMASKSGFATAINQTVTDQGVNVTITEMINDGVRLSIGGVFEFPEGVDGSQGVLGFVYSVPGHENIRIARNGIAWKWSHLKDNKYSGIMEVPIDTLPEEYKLKMTFDEIGSVKGQWGFEIPVVRTAETLGTQTFEVNDKQQLNGTTDIHLERVKIAPSATSIEFSMQGPEVEKWIVNNVGTVKVHSTPLIWVYDDKGNRLKEITQYIHNHAADSINTEVVVSPLKHRPEYITVKMQEYFRNFDPTKEYKITNEFKVPVPPAEKK